MAATAESMRKINNCWKVYCIKNKWIANIFEVDNRSNNMQFTFGSSNIIITIFIDAHRIN